MQNLIIIGTGASASEITSYLEEGVFGEYNLKGYLEFENNIAKYYDTYNFSKPVLGDVDCYQIQEDDVFVMGIAHIQFRLKMIEKIQGRGGKFINLIHPSVIVAKTAQLGEGNIVYPFCVIGPKAQIGNHNMLTSYSFISHDCAIGNNNFFSTAGLAGGVKIGNNNFFGIRSTVIPHTTIGSDNTIQAGMTIEKDITDNTTVFHRFKEKVLIIKE